MKPVLVSLLTRGAVFPLTAAAVLTTTFFTIDYVGVIEFGAISLIATLTLLIPFADLGLGAAIINGVSQAKNKDEALQLSLRVFHVLFIPGVLMLIAAIGSYWFVDWGMILGIQTLQSESIQLAVFSVLCIFAFSIPLSTGQRILIGLQKNHIAILFASSASVIALISVLTLRAFEMPSAFLSVAQPLGLLVGGILSSFYAFRELGLKRIRESMSHQFSRPYFDFSALRLGLPMMIILLGLPIAFQTQRLILSHQATPEELSSFGLAMQIYNPIWSFISVSAIALWPVFSARRIPGSTSISRRFVLVALLFFASIGGLAFVGFWLFGTPIGLLASGNAISLAASLCLSMGFLVFAQSVQQVPGMYLTDVSGMWFQAILVTCLAVVVPISAWMFAPSFGSAGTVLCLALGILVIQVVPGYIRVLLRPCKRNISS